MGKPGAQRMYLVLANLPLTAVEIHLSPQMSGTVCIFPLSFRFHNLLDMTQSKRTTQTQHISVVTHIQQTYYNII